MIGPAFVAAIAYVDPGNVATNVTAGARFGFTLLWVVVLASLAAILMQFLAAKLGVVTAHSLVVHMRTRLPTPLRWAYWAQAEIVVIATDVAEVIGGAVALQLLFRVPLVLGAAITTAVAIVVLRLGDRGGPAVLERVVIGFLAVIALGFVAGLVVAPPAGAEVVRGFGPRLAGRDSVVLAAGIVGATLMPHAIYLHSGLTADRPRGTAYDVPRRLRATRVDVLGALSLAALLNVALLAVAASSLAGVVGTDTLAGAHAAIRERLGEAVAVLFALGLLGSGLASAAVGGAAGDQVMAGLVGRRVPPLVQRLVALVPAVAVLGAGLDPTRLLVGSQVVLALGLPFALVPLVWLTSCRSVMGAHRNPLLTTWVASGAVAVIAGLDVALVFAAVR
jgi:manganese transport protein